MEPALAALAREIAWLSARGDAHLLVDLPEPGAEAAADGFRSFEQRKTLYIVARTRTVANDGAQLNSVPIQGSDIVVYTNVRSQEPDTARLRINASSCHVCFFLPGSIGVEIASQLVRLFPKLVSRAEGPPIALLGGPEAFPNEIKVVFRRAGSVDEARSLFHRLFGSSRHAGNSSPIPQSR